MMQRRATIAPTSQDNAVRAEKRVADTPPVTTTAVDDTEATLPITTSTQHYPSHSNGISDVKRATRNGNNELNGKTRQPSSAELLAHSPSLPNGRTLSGNSHATPSEEIQPSPRIWRKVLYERQPFEDNYVDPTQFLQELRTNANVKNYRYVDVVQDTVIITQHISIVVIFVYAFAMVLTGQTERYTLLYVDCVILAIAWLLYVYLHTNNAVGTTTTNSTTASAVNGNINLGITASYSNMDVSAAAAAATESASALGVYPQRRSFLHRLLTDVNPSVFSLVVVLALLTPILSTLTVTYSDDTIVALSILTMSLHVLTADYSYLNAYTFKYQPNLSVNAATFGVILMASRIRSPLQNGALIAFGAICFSISPIARHTLKRYSFAAHALVTLLLFLFATTCLVQIPILAVFFVSLGVVVTFIIPLCFVRLHSSVKNQINGPWDEAKPTNSAAAAEWANSGLLT